MIAARFSLFFPFSPPSPFLRAAIIKTIHKPSNNGRLINRGRGSSRLRNEARASKFDKMDSPLFSIRPMTNGRERKIKRQHTICIFAWRGRGLSVNRQAPYSSTKKRSKAFPTLDQSVKRNTGFEGLRNQPLPPLDLYGPVVTHNARLVKGARTKVDERICRLFNANVTRISYIPRETFRAGQQHSQRVQI